MKHAHGSYGCTVTMAVALFFLSLTAFAQTGAVVSERMTLLSGDSLVAGQTRWSPSPITIPDTTSRHRIIAYTLGQNPSPWITPVNNFNVIARVYKDGSYSDTISLGTLSSAGNASMTIATKTMKELQNYWIPGLSGSDSTAVWYLRNSGGFQVQYGVKPFGTHKGGQDIILVLDTP